MIKIIKDKQGYIHTTQSIKDTEITLATVKDGDVVSFTRNTKDGGCGWASIIMDGKQFDSSFRRSDTNKTLLEYANEGYDLKIIGHWMDGKAPDAFWNNPARYGFDLIDLMLLNATLQRA